ncbi:MAG: hypothetical protein HY904_04310 [Deltaproteobacteria bacterium]|nr:hypothetical protein [Deltaproteobacteria bacterium]
MAWVRTFGRVARATLAVLLPVGTLLACLGLLLLAVHVAADPVAHGARFILDTLDAAADATGAWLVRGWASAWDWSDKRVAAVVEAWTELVDVQEKLAATHLVGLVVEGVLFFAFLPLAWHADPYELVLRPPARMAADLRSWFLGLSAWVRLERILVVFCGLGGGLSLARFVRAQVVATAAGDLGVPLNALTGVGLAAAVFTLWLVVVCALLPMVAVDATRTTRASRTRRLLCLVCAFLIVAAAAGEVVA